MKRDVETKRNLYLGLHSQLAKTEDQLDLTEDQLAAVKQKNLSLNKELTTRRSHLGPLPLHPKEQAVIPKALYVAMTTCYESRGDYDSLGVCAAVLCWRLKRRSVELLPPHDFLQFIGENQQYFIIQEDSVVLKEEFNDCMPKMEDILNLHMSPLMSGQTWGYTFNKIRERVENSGDENDQWFVVHLPPRDVAWSKTPQGQAHVFICFATQNAVDGCYGICDGWSYTLYDQTTREQINPFEQHEWSHKFVNSWRIFFNSQSVPGPVGSASKEVSWRMEAPETALPESVLDLYASSSSDAPTEPWD